MQSASDIPLDKLSWSTDKESDEKRGCVPSLNSLKTKNCQKETWLETMVVVRVARRRRTHQRKPSDFHLFSSSCSSNCNSRAYHENPSLVAVVVCFPSSVMTSPERFAWVSGDLWRARCRWVIWNKRLIQRWPWFVNRSSVLHPTKVPKGSYIVWYINLRSSPCSSLEPKQARRILVSPDLVDEHWRRLKVISWKLS